MFYDKQDLNLKACELKIKELNSKAETLKLADVRNLWYLYPPDVYSLSPPDAVNGGGLLSFKNECVANMIYLYLIIVKSLVH